MQLSVCLDSFSLIISRLTSLSFLRLYVRLCCSLLKQLLLRDACLGVCLWVEIVIIPGHSVIKCEHSGCDLRFYISGRVKRTDALHHQYSVDKLKPKERKKVTFYCSL